jgi:hypothetical protein
MKNELSMALAGDPEIAGLPPSFDMRLRGTDREPAT